MKPSDATVRSTLYDANVMVQAELVDVNLAIGHQRWTTAGQNVSVGGATYYAGGPVIEHGSIRVTNEPGEIPTCDLSLRGDYAVAGVDLAARARAGDFDDRDVAFSRVYMPTWAASPTMAVDAFSGRVAEVVFDSYSVELRLKAITYKTQERRPLRVVQSMCPWVLYASECGATKASFSALDTVAAGSTALVVILGAGTAWATPGGTMQFNTGNLAGITAVIRSYNSGTRAATLVTQLPQVPDVNSQVYVSRGCDRRRATCGTTFSRLVAFGGFPDAPRKGA